MDTNPLILPVFSTLLALGVAYNALVAWMERHGLEGWTWLQVVGGVGFTLIGAWLLVGDVIVWVMLCFVASGTPMIIGAVVRREQRIRRLIERGNGK